MAFWIRSALFILLAATTVLAHDVPEKPPIWTHYLRVGAAQLEQWGGMGFYRIKRIHGNSFNDLRILGIFLSDETWAILRYKSSRKFELFPRFYKFTIVSLRHSSKAELTIRYHYNQGFGAFVYTLPSSHLTTETALSYDMSDYLHDTRKTSYLKGGLFWDVDVAKSSLALDLEYFQQISDIIPGEGNLTRYEVSTELNIPLTKGYVVTLGYEEEFYASQHNQNVRSVYVAIGFKRLLPLTF